MSKKITEKSYHGFIAEIKQSIIKSRYQAARVANREQLLLYLFIGKRLSEKIENEKWGTKVLEQISRDLQTELPGLRGFSVRSLKNMRQFADESLLLLIGQSATAQFKKVKLPSSTAGIARSPEVKPDNEFGQSATALLGNMIGQSVTAQLKKERKPVGLTENPLNIFFGISFTHHILILNKCKDIKERFFYMQLAATEMLSVSGIEHHIEANTYKKQGKLPNNFTTTLPAKMRSTALNVFKDEYLFDFMPLDDTETERVFEEKLVANIRKFKPEYAGKLNFYLNVLDDKAKLPHENPSIGIILCKEKNNAVVEYSCKSINKAMGVATYKLSTEVPKEMKGILPNAETLKKLLK